MKRILFGLILALYPTFILGYLGIEDYESTRIKSSAGAGIATVLLNESPLLNPASAIFFNKSSFYYQKDNTSLDEEAKNRPSKYRNENSEALTIIDTSSAVKGGLSYQYQRTNAGKRVRYSTSLAGPISKKTGLGLIYRYSEEQSLIYEEKYSQFVAGIMYVHSEKLVLGGTIVDPVQDKPEYFNYTAGVHFKISPFFTLIFDIGSGDVHNYSDEAFTKWAIQLNSFKNFFIRYGQFHNKNTNKQGTGVGFSWIGPRLSLDWALKTYEIIEEKTDMIFEDDSVREMSLGTTILF